MIGKLIEESVQFIDALYGNVEECDQEDIFARICSDNNSLLFIIHHVRNKNTELLVKFYEERRTEPRFNTIKFFMNLLTLIRYEYNQEYCKQLLGCLLQIEQNKSQFLNLLPEELFKEIKRYNPVTYERREKRVIEKMSEFERISDIQENSRGFAEIVLAITTYMQHGIVKRSHEETWNKVLDIVGRYNLDFLKVSNMMLNKAIDYLNLNNEEQVLSIIEHISFDNFILLAGNKIYEASEQDKEDLVYIGSITSFATHSTMDLFQSNRYFYNPKYIELIRALTHKGVYQLDQFVQHFRSITAERIREIELEKLKATEELVTEVFNLSLNQHAAKQQSNKRPQTLVMGQAFHCFKLAIMAEFIRCNDFLTFKKLYSSIAGTDKFDLIVHMPLVREFCLLIEWIIEPIYIKASSARFFKRAHRIHATGKESGYFKQHHEVGEQLFIDLQEILSYLQFNIGFHIKTLVKVLRLFKIILHHNYFKIEWTQLIGFKKVIRELIQAYLFPAITVQEQHCNLAFEMHALLLEYTQEERFQIYLHYYSEIMFKHTYLATVLENAIKGQFKILSKFNPKNQEMYFAQTLQLSKWQHNQFLHCSLYLNKRALSEIFENQTDHYAYIISRSTPLAADGTLFLLLDYFASNRQKIKLDEKQFNLFTSFLSSLFKSCKALDLSFFVKLTLKMMCEQSSSSDFYDFHCSLRILKLILEQAFPDLVQYKNYKMRLEFLTFGYHMKLELVDQVGEFKGHSSIRERLISILSSKLIDSNKTQHCLLYYFLQITASRIYTINKSIASISESGLLIDECMEFMNSLCRFFAYQMDRVREAHPNRLIEVFCVSENDFIELFKEEESKIPQPFACLLLRALKKHDLYSTKLYMLAPLKKLWEKIYKGITFTPSRFTCFASNQINSARANSFIHSDFYFYFWTSDLQNICQLEERYKLKVEELRKIISKGDIFNADPDQFEKENKEKYILTYKLIERQREELMFYYQKFNIPVTVIGSNGTPERVSKLSIPTLFAVKNESELKEFVNLLFLHCLLPRMTTDYSQAIFCSKIVYKIIKENKLPSNKSLTMIFMLIEAAVSYIPHSTQRETRCISIFTSDFMRLFNGWDQIQELSSKLQAEIGMEKFNEKRYEKLKDYLMHFQENVTSKLILNKNEAYVIKNCMLFLEKNEHLPLSHNQSELILKFLADLKTENAEQTQNISIFLSRIKSMIEARSSHLPKFSTFNYETQMRKFGMINELKSSSSKPKIYNQQPQKKGKKPKEYINIY